MRISFSLVFLGTLLSQQSAIADPTSGKCENPARCRCECYYQVAVASGSGYCSITDDSQKQCSISFNGRVTKPPQQASPDGSVLFNGIPDSSSPEFLPLLQSTIGALQNLDSLRRNPVAANRTLFLLARASYVSLPQIDQKAIDFLDAGVAKLIQENNNAVRFFIPRETSGEQGDSAGFVKSGYLFTRLDRFTVRVLNRDLIK